MTAWFVTAFTAGVVSIFLIFLSGIVHKKPLGAVLMFVFALLASASLGYGLYNAHLDAQQNLGKPILQIERGEYEIFWIARNMRDGKMHLVADKMGDQDVIPRYYAIDPSDPFIKELNNLLKSGGRMKLRVGEDDKGEITFELYPNPPEPLPPKVEP